MCHLFLWEMIFCKIGLSTAGSLLVVGLLQVTIFTCGLQGKG